MSLTVAQVIEDMRHALGGPVSSAAMELALVNEAAEHFTSMHEWLFLRRRSVRLDLRGRITVEAATWASGTDILTKAGAFSDYAVGAGDRFVPTSGTAVKAEASFGVMATDGANTITLDGEITTDNTNPTDVAGYVDRDYIELPADVAAVDTLEPTDNLIQSLTPCTPDQLQQYKSDPAAINPFGYFYALSWAVQAGTGSVVPRLEIWPLVTGATDYGYATLWYQARLGGYTQGSDLVLIPPFAHRLLKAVAREFAKGVGGDTPGQADSLGARLAAIEAGPLFQSTARRDGRMLPSIGKVRGSIVGELDLDAPHNISPSTIPSPT